MKANRFLTLIAGGIAVAALAAFAVACGGDDDDDTGAGSPTAEATATPEATSEPITIGDITINEPFARAALDRGSVYFTVENTGTEDDALIGASSDIAGTVELHQTVTEGASTMMKPVDKIVVPAGETTTLKPGGLHVMMTELTRELKMDDTFSVTLEFEKAGSVDLEVTVTSYTEETMSGSATPMQ